MRRYLIVFFLSLLVFFIGFGLWWYHQKPAILDQKKATLPQEDVAKQHRLVVFVHGTFGALLSLLDTPSVLRDKVSGSRYARTVDRARRDHFFFRTQPLHHCGLVSFIPSFEKSESVGLFAAYPIAKAFDVLYGITRKKAEKRHYYLFGWSGLLSQASRRQDAVRLLNQLSKEVHSFRAKGIDPKITLVCHSHGGNVVLNLGLIASLLRGEVLSDDPGIVDQRTLKKLQILLGSLPLESQLNGKEGQEQWDYLPEEPDWKIDQTLFLATPIQPETDAGIFSSFFERIYSWYSYADGIQISDCISTTRFFSERRFSRLSKLLRAVGKKLPEKLMQVRVMTGRGKENNKIIPARGVFTKDPSHKDFWFLGSKRFGRKHLFKPLPVLTFFPIISEFLDANRAFSDVDVNISADEDRLIFDVMRHNQVDILAETSIPRSFFEDVRLQASSWSGHFSLFMRVLRFLHMI